MGEVMEVGKTGRACKCEACGWEWFSRLAGGPARCARCGTPKWRDGLDKRLVDVPGPDALGSDSQGIGEGSEDDW